MLTSPAAPERLRRTLPGPAPALQTPDDCLRLVQRAHAGEGRGLVPPGRGGQGKQVRAGEFEGVRFVPSGESFSVQLEVRAMLIIGRRRMLRESRCSSCKRRRAWPRHTRDGCVYLPLSSDPCRTRCACRDQNRDWEQVVHCYCSCEPEPAL